jgi:hypothetical protein
VEFSTKENRRVAVEAAAWVDATGDAQLAQLAGAPCEIAPSERLQRPAFIFTLSGVEPGALDADGRVRLAARIAAGVRSGALHAGALGASFRAADDTAYVTLDLAAPSYDPTDAAQTVSLRAQGRALATALHAFLTTNAPGFASARIAEMAAQLGIRESRRVIGDTILTGQHILDASQPADTVAQAAWPLELRESSHGPRWRFPASAAPAGIPLSALRWRGTAARYVAGRCLSCDHEAQASIRVIGTALAIGAALGAVI